MSSDKQVQIEMFFDHSPEKLFDAWLDPQNISTWLLATDKEILSVDIDAQVGGAFCFRVRRDGQKIDHVGKYLKINRAKVLAFTWGVPFYSKEYSTVEITFERAHTQTKLTLIQSNVLPEYLESSKKGWTRILNELDSKLEQNKKPHKA